MRSPCIGGQRPTGRFIIAAVLGIVGVLLIVGLGVGAVSGWGVAVSVAALFMFSLGAILTTRWRDGAPLVATTSWQMCAGGIILVILAAVFEGAPPVVGAAGIAAYGFTSIAATAVASLCWFAGMRHLSAGAVGVIGLLNPVTGVLLGTLLGAEILSLAQVLGIALVLAAILLGNFFAPRSPREVPSARKIRGCTA